MGPLDLPLHVGPIADGEFHRRYLLKGLLPRHSAGIREEPIHDCLPQEGAYGLPLRLGQRQECGVLGVVQEDLDLVRQDWHLLVFLRFQHYSWIESIQYRVSCQDS